ncbi:glycosyltransferase family 4 protein [Candidatus Gracilibacteria bacterium]|nr:glycosyltransferase family 4 protein [Candidatus Gracilibacteria bacterium]
MKIGIDARMFSKSFTGIGRYNYELTKRLFQKREDIEWVLFMNEPEFLEFKAPRNVKKVLVNAHHYSLAEQFRFLNILKKEKCDLIHFTHFNAPILYKGKFVTTIHDTLISFYPGKKMNSWWRKLAYNKVIKHTVNDAVRVITVSDNTKNDVIKLFNIAPQKITKIWNGIGEEFYEVSDLEKKTVKEKFGLGKDFLLYTGNWREHKNLVRLLRAFKKVLEKGHSPLQLVITGKSDPYYPEVLETIKELELQDKVKLLGLVSEEDLVRLYNTASVYVFPSLYEGFGLPPLEAMKCGTPVVASHVSAIPEVCGDAVLYFDPENILDMAEKINLLLTDSTLQQDLVKKGYEHVKQFSWEKCASETLKIYDSVLE